MIRQPSPYHIPENELFLSFSRSGGAGGQNVNKRDTKAQLKWHILGSNVFSTEQKRILEQELRHWINTDGYVIITNQESRSQEQNKQHAIHRLNELVTNALTPEKDRIATKPSWSSTLRRLQEKQRDSRKKTNRRTIAHWDES